MNWNNILNWKLLKGSHDFPGPDGGTCINEAAIVAAGLKYHKVSHASDCPPCFSRPIAAYAIGLNDAMPDALRQDLLLPFVVRLAGTADTSAVEKKRAEYIVVQTVKTILPIILRLTGLYDEATRCAKVDLLSDARDAACAAARTASAASDAACAAKYAAATVVAKYTASAASDAACAAEYDAATVAAKYAAATAEYSVRATAVRPDEVFIAAVSILDGVLKIGKQAEPIETALVVKRMKEAVE
jgi:hypothetical protein